EKDAFAGVNQGGHIAKPAGISELIADLVERHRVAEPGHHGARVLDRRQIEGDDQALARLKRHRSVPCHDITPANSTSRRASVRSAAASASSFRLSMSSNA